MNVDTGEIRELTQEEVARLNEEAGRKLWQHLDPQNPVDDIPLNQRVPKTYHLSRKQRRTEMRKQFGKSEFELTLQETEVYSQPSKDR